MDLERLTKAYANEPYEVERDADLHRALGKGKFAPWERDIERLLVRNAQLRDLLANGERVEPDFPTDFPTDEDVEVAAKVIRDYGMNLAALMGGNTTGSVDATLTTRAALQVVADARRTEEEG